MNKVINSNKESLFAGPRTESSAAAWYLGNPFLQIPAPSIRSTSNSPHSSSPSTGLAASSSTTSLTLFRANSWYCTITLLLLASLLDLYLFLAVHRLSFLHHLTLLLFFTLLLPNSLPDPFLFLLASLPFLLHHYLLLQHTIPPLTTAIHTLSAHTSLLCAASCLRLSISRHSFSAEFILSSGLVLKFRIAWSCKGNCYILENVRMKRYL